MVLIGSIQKKGRIYYVVLSDGRDPKTRKWKSKWIRVGTDEAEAESRLAEIRGEYGQGRYRDNEKMTVGEYLDHWLENYAKTAVRRSTYESYDWAINRHIVPILGRLPLQKLVPLDIQRMLSKLAATNLSATSVSYVYNVLNIALNRAIKWLILSKNPCIAVTPPRKEKYHAQTYTPEQLATLLQTAENTNLYLPVLLAAGCGLRRGEVCGLRWEDVNTEAKVMFIRNSLDRPEKGKLSLLPVKTDHSERAVRMPEFLLTALVAAKNKQSIAKAKLKKSFVEKDFVFAWENGEPVDPDYLDRKFRALIADNQLAPIRFHDLRHTHATLLLLQHVAVKVVSERLGHSSVNITQDIYSHVLPEMQKEAAAAIDTLLDAVTENRASLTAPTNVINFAEAQKMRAARSTPA